MAESIAKSKPFIIKKNFHQQQPQQQLLLCSQPPPAPQNEMNEQLLQNVYESPEKKDEGNSINLDNLKPASSLKATRAKTPMCLINDLARFNKISFQYRLIGESGLAHCKRFTVALKLGDEEYTAEGGKVKDAQHLAAKEAIEKTKYKHPIPKTIRRNDTQGLKGTNITPTVELNALAMKLGQQTYYIFDPRQMPASENVRPPNETYRPNLAHEIQSGQLMTQPPPPPPLMVNNERNPNLRGHHNNMGGIFVPNLAHNGSIKQPPQPWSYLPKSQLCYPTYPRNNPNVIMPTNANPLNTSYFPPTAPCQITLIVGTQKFVGIGRTPQQAKHDAASKALQILKEQLNSQQKQVHDVSIDNEENENASPISLVFEIGVKRNMPVDFKVLREEGPAHMRIFTTACIVGNIVTEGVGAGKKISKKKAAQNMLIELKKLPPVTETESAVKRVKIKSTTKKPPKTFAQPKEEHYRNKNPTTELDPTANPIKKLLEWHQHNKKGEPEYKLINELGKEKSRRRQYTMEVSSNNIVARGVGNSKKLAKLNAAHNFLLAIEGQPQEIANVTTTEETVVKTPSIPINTSTTAAVSALPTTTVIPNKSKQEEIPKKSPIIPENVKEPKSIEIKEPVAPQNAPAAQDISTNVNSAPTVDKPSNAPTFPAAKSCNLSMKNQLMYLANLMGFEVVFSDYPKGNHNEFLTIVMLSTNPPQICHGVGNNANESQENASSNALKILSEMGFNNSTKS